MDKKKIKVLKFIHSGTFAGVENLILALAKKIDRKRFKIDIACPEGKVAQGFKKKGLEEMGIRVWPIRIKGNFDPGGIWELAKLIKKEKYRIVHVYQAASGVSGRLAARLAGFPKIVVTENTVAYTHYWIKNPLSLFFHQCIWHKVWNTFFVDKIIAVSRDVYKSILERERVSPEKVAVVHNGIDAADFNVSDQDIQASRKEFGLSPETKCIGTLARLDQEKGISYFIGALSRVSKKVPDFKALIVGDGPMRQELEKKAENLGLSEKIIFTGWRSDAARVLAMLDIFVFPTLREAFGLAALEAMASRVPVVASKVGGVVDIIEDKKNGLLVPPKDETALAEAITFLLENGDVAQRIKEEGKRTVEEKFSSEIAAKGIEKVYEQLLKEGK